MPGGTDSGGTSRATVLSAWVLERDRLLATVELTNTRRGESPGVVGFEGQRRGCVMLAAIGGIFGV
jgi:hypothetical protein